MKIEFKKINKYFDKNHVLKDVTFSVESGQVFGFLGRNGAGKTTTLRILMDVFKQNSGEILIDGNTFNPKNYSIGYLPEERGMYSKTVVLDQLVYFGMLRGATRQEATKSSKEWAEKFNISEYLNRKLDTLSKGNQQKVQITQAFINNPDILILDEPFSGLDPVNSQVFQDALNDYIDKDKIIIFSSHQMSYVETFCERIAIINHGEIVLDGKLDQIKKELGNGKIRIKTSAKTEEFNNYLVTNGYVVESDKVSSIVTLSEGVTKNMLLKLIIDGGYELQLFTDYKPSLQEIFVSKVGDDHE